MFCAPSAGGAAAELQRLLLLKQEPQPDEKTFPLKLHKTVAQDLGETAMEAKIPNEKTLSMACHWRRSAVTGRLECHWRRETPVKREDVVTHFALAA